MTAPGDDTNVGGIVAHFRIDGGPEGRRELEEIQRRAEALGRVNPTIRITSNAAELRAQADALQARLEALARLNPDIRIGSNSAAVQADLASIRARMDALGAENTTLRFDLTQAQAQIEALRQRTGRQGGIAGRDFGAQFTRGLRETLASIPKIEIDGDTSDVDRQIQEVRAQLEELSKKRVGFDISAEDAMRSLAALQGELEALKAQAGDVDVRFNTAAATARLARLRAQLGDLGNTDIGGGRFAAQLAKAIREATAALPKIDVDADATPAQRKLAEIRARMVELGQQKIGVDITAAEAAAKLKLLQSELDKLHRSARDDVRIRMDTAAASAKLAALRKEMDGLQRAGTGGAGGIGGTGPLIFGAIIAGAAVAGPLVAAATAGAVGLAGAVGVAALAYKGLKDAEEDETKTGLQIRAQFKGIGAELGQLETIAANRAAPGVLGALGKIRAYVPLLDGPVAGLARHLGSALNIGTGGLITGLKVMTPLLDDAGNYAEHLAQKLADFTASPQFAQFISYARQELPIVGSELADVAGGLIQVGVTLQPLGDKLLSIIATISRGTGAAAEFVRTLRELGITAGGDSDTLVTAGGLPAIGRTIGFGGANSGSSYFGGNTPSNFQKGGNLLVSGAIGLATGNTQTDKAARNALGQARPAAIQSAQAQELVTAYARREEAARQRVAAATKAQEGRLQALATKYGTTLPVMQSIVDRERQTATQLAATTLAMQRQDDASGLLKAALDALDGKKMTAAQAENAFEQSLVSGSQALESQKEAAKGQSREVQRSATAITGLSQAAIANRGSILGQVQAAEAAAGAHGDLAKSSDAAKARLVVLRKQIIDNAVAHGADRKAVTAYINSFLDLSKLKPAKTSVDFADADARAKANQFKAFVATLPKSIRTAVSLAGVSSAEYQLQLLARQRTARINVVTTGGGGAAYHQSVGGRQVFASGGTVHGEGGPREDKVIAFVSPGEEIIKNGPAQKYRALLKAINAGRFADGGTVGGLITLTPKAPAKSGGGTHSTTSHIGASNTKTPYEYDGIYYSTAIAAANARTRALRRKPKEIIDTIVDTAGKGAAYGIASYIRGQIPSVRQATHLLSLAVDDAFALKGVQAKVARIRADLEKLREKAKATSDSAGAKLSDGSDPGQFGNIQQYTAYLQAKAAQNNRFTGQIKHLEGNKAIPADLLARFAGDGPSAALDSFAGANKRDVTALLRASAGFDRSVTGGTRQAASIYGPAIAKDTANLNKALAQSARTEQAMVNVVLKLAHLVNKPVTIKLDGKSLVTTKIVHDEVQGVIDELRNLLVTGKQHH